MSERDRDLYLACLSGWAEMYVKGYWTLAQFEEHADKMRLSSVIRPLY